MTEVIVVEDAEAAGELVAQHIAEQIAAKANFVWGLATGSTPLTTYQALARIIRERGLDVSRVRGFALDEYVGLPREHPESYASVIRRAVVEPLGLNPELIHTPDGNAETTETAGVVYEAMIRAAGGVDLQILGVGSDGHSGFNEPGSSLASRTRIKTLTQSTIADNARFFDSPADVPHHCMTQGIGTIMEARHVILLAFGAGKQRAVADCVEGAVTAFNPGSALQLHPHATVVVDKVAGAKLQNLDYYQYAYRNKPAWQGL
jgi:glucosamine-6-phosphate deaminase